MSAARRVFEALMRSKGHDDFTTTEAGRYVVPSLQARWVYFQTGWEMANAMKEQP